MSALPENWVLATVADVTSYVKRGKSPKYVEFSELPVINQKCVRWHGIEEQHLKFVDPAQWPSWGEERLLRKGDVLWNSTGTGTIGRACLYEGLASAERAVADSHVTIVRPSQAIESSYLHRLIQSPLVRNKIDEMQSGSTNQVELSKEEVLATPVPLPPLAEQRRIVAKISSLSGKSKRALDHLSHASNLIKGYKTAVLRAAFRGDLTSKWRAENGITDSGTVEASISEPFRETFRAPSSWMNVGFNDVCDIVGGSQPPKSTFHYSPGEDLIRLIQIRDYKSDSKITYIPKALARRFCTETDIMIGRYGPPNFQILRGLRGAYNVALMKAVPNPDLIEQEFLFWYLQHPSLFEYVDIDAQRTAGQEGVNKAHLMKWPVLLPPRPEQLEIVHRIKTAFAWIARLASEANSARKLIDHLDQAILSKAFRGGLVPQDPNDEPASVLLERIKAEKAMGSGKKRGKQ